MKNDFIYNEYEIIHKKALAPDTFLFRFRGHLIFQPGQFVQASLDHFGQATFAPCSDPHIKSYFELCIRSVGNLSAQIVKLLPGDKLKIRGPYGNGWPVEEMLWNDIVLIGGGMGIVPLRPLIYQLLHDRINFSRIHLYAGFKTPQDVIFSYELREWRRKLNTSAVTVEHTDTKFWGRAGLITEPLAEAIINPKKTVVLICGPEPMYKFVNEILKKKGLKDDQIFLSFERRMECGIGICQHCNIGKYTVCQDGPVFRLDEIQGEIGK